MEQHEYERARNRLHEALESIQADDISPCTSFVALVDLLVDRSLQSGGKSALWEAVALMHNRVGELSQVERQVPAELVN